MNRIVITCPHCEHQQEEPAKVLSCYCRQCRAHLDIERDHVKWEHLDLPADAGLFTKIKSLITKRPASRPVEAEEPQRLKIRSGSESYEARQKTSPAELSKRTGTVKKVSAPIKASGSPGMNPPGQGRATKFRSERILHCYACEQSFTASKLGPAPACPHCEAFFSSNDRVVEAPTGEDICTYGNVRVLSRGALTGGKLRCHHLAAYGPLGGDIKCSGRVECNASGKMDATLSCRELIIPRKVKIEFTGLVEADHIEVQGEITARALINGELVVDSSGVFNGQVVTRTLAVEDDAELNAAVQIDTDPFSLRNEIGNLAVSD